MFKVSCNIDLSEQNGIKYNETGLNGFIKLYQVENFFGPSLDVSRPAEDILVEYILKNTNPFYRDPKWSKVSVEVTSMEFINPDMTLANIGKDLLKKYKSKKIANIGKNMLTGFKL